MKLRCCHNIPLYQHCTYWTLNVQLDMFLGNISSAENLYLTEANTRLCSV